MARSTPEDPFYVEPAVSVPAADDEPPIDYGHTQTSYGDNNPVPPPNVPEDET